MVTNTPGPGCPSPPSHRAARLTEPLPPDPPPPPPASEPQPPIGVREGIFAADDDEWPDADADADGDGAVLGWADRDDADGRSTPRGTDGGATVDRPVPPERGWPGIRERLTHRFSASLHGVVTAPAASATLVLALLALAAAFLATWFAWQHRPVSVAAPAQRPSVVVAAPDGTPDGGSVDARTAVGRTAAVGAVAAVASPAASTGAATEVVVDVAGRVTRPGAIRLPAGSRVVDAIDRVGGVLAGTDTTGIGLARVLVDGEQILVDGRPGPPPAMAVPAPGASTAAGTSGGGSDGGGGGQGGPIDLNSASSEQLDGLPGVGPVLAGRIVAWRTEHGPFRSPEQLGEVTGLGYKRLADLLPLVKV